jgi:hypothetical protein
VITTLSLVHDKSADSGVNDFCDLMPSLMSQVPTVQEEATLALALQTNQDSMVYTLAFGITDTFV